MPACAQGPIAHFLRGRTVTRVVGPTCSFARRASRSSTYSQIWASVVAVSSREKALTNRCIAIRSRQLSDRTHETYYVLELGRTDRAIVREELRDVRYVCCKGCGLLRPGAPQQLVDVPVSSEVQPHS